MMVLVVMVPPEQWLSKYDPNNDKNATKED